MFDMPRERYEMHETEGRERRAAHTDPETLTYKLLERTGSKTDQRSVTV